MAENTIRRIKWFWPWQDEKEEAWLRSMSQSGWHLFSVGVPCTYRFRAGEPRNYVYRSDYQTYKKEDEQDYLQLFSDAGWEHLGQMSASHYFRKEAKEGEALEIFTDVESKVARYKRVLSYLAFFAVIWIVIFFRKIWSDSPYTWSYHLWVFLRIVSLPVMGGLIYAIIGLVLRIRQLRRL